MTKRYKQCSVCGSDAGRFEQHWNRDTGYGICRKCADWVQGPTRGQHRIEPLEMAWSYGLPGKHYEPHYFPHMGRRFAIVAEFTDSDEGTKQANAFMLKNEGTSLLAVHEGRVILAHNDDKGEA